MKKKKRKIHKNNKLQLLQNQIKEHSHLLPCHNIYNIKGMSKQNTDSQIQSANNTDYSNLKINKLDVLDNTDIDLNAANYYTEALANASIFSHGSLGVSKNMY